MADNFANFAELSAISSNIDSKLCPKGKEVISMNFPKVFCACLLVITIFSLVGCGEDEPVNSHYTYTEGSVELEGKSFNYELSELHAQTDEQYRTWIVVVTLQEEGGGHIQASSDENNNWRHLTVCGEPLERDLGNFDTCSTAWRPEPSDAWQEIISYGEDSPTLSQDDLQRITGLLNTFRSLYEKGGVGYDSVVTEMSEPD